MNSVDELRAERDAMRQRGPWSFMDFHGHDNSGVIALGREGLDDWEPFRHRGYEDMFGPGSRIELHGCYVASDPVGEYFLAACAYTFLHINGGSVLGYRVLSYSFGIGETPFHTPLPNNECEAHIEPGGQIHLVGAAHLNRHYLQTRLSQLRARLDRDRWQAQPYLEWRLARARQRLSIAESWLMTQSGGYRALFHAAETLDRADADISLALARPPTRIGVRSDDI